MMTHKKAPARRARAAGTAKKPHRARTRRTDKARSNSRRGQPHDAGEKVVLVPLSDVTPSPENDAIYRPIDLDDPEIIALAESIREQGLLEPLVVTNDLFVASGHRRLAAARLAGLSSVPCRVLSFSRAHDIDRFVRRLREFNRQRDKTLDEKLREEVVTMSPEDAHVELMEYRREKAAIRVDTIEVDGESRRKVISDAKEEFAAAIRREIEALRDYWPVSVRQVHYRLLNDPPLRHVRKPQSRYRNDHESYRSLDDLITRMRLTGDIWMDIIDDETRPVDVWRTHRTVRNYCRNDIEGLLTTYWRDLMQSQPNHIELITEKNTAAATIRSVAREYTIPHTVARGFCSLPPRQKIADRFEQSGKDKLVLLIISDFDPDGEEIAHSLVRSMRDDFEIESVEAVKAALTAEQAALHRLPPNSDAKQSSANFKKFASKYGTAVYELEALHPNQLQQIVRETIESVLDRDAYSFEIEAEKQDAHFLRRVRQAVKKSLATLDLGDVQ